MDDPLSAVDAHVGAHLFEQCLASKGFLGRTKSTRILVTHQVHFLKSANHVIIMKDGKIDQQGSPSDLAAAGVDFMKLCEETEGKLSRRESLSRSISRSSASIDGSVEDDEAEESEDDNPEKQKNVEELSKGKVKGNVMMNYLKSGGSYCKLLMVVFMFALTQAFASMFDYWVGYWTSSEEARYLSMSENDGNEANETLILDNETVSRERTFDLTNLSSESLIYIAGFLIAALFIFAIVRSIFFYTITIVASRNLHKTAFNGIIAADMRFFDLNPSGRILNRFSKDLGTIDEWLPKCLLDATQIILMTVGGIVVTTVINPIFLVPIGFLFVLFIYMRRYYLKTSKNIKRLEGITKSPAFVHLAATINGLSTIRAFGAQEALRKEFDQHQVS